MDILVTIQSEERWWFHNYFHFMVDAILGLYLILKNTETLASKDLWVNYEGNYRGIVEYFCPPSRINQRIDLLTFPLVLTIGGKFENRRKPTESAFNFLPEMAAYILDHSRGEHCICHPNRESGDCRPFRGSSFPANCWISGRFGGLWCTQFRATGILCAVQFHIGWCPRRSSDKHALSPGKGDRR
jgi:hypothetical protein